MPEDALHDAAQRRQIRPQRMRPDDLPSGHQLYDLRRQLIAEVAQPVLATEEIESDAIFHSDDRPIGPLRLSFIATSPVEGENSSSDRPASRAPLASRQTGLLADAATTTRTD